MKAKTKAKPAPAETEPLVPENIDKYVEVACSIVAELGGLFARSLRLR